MSSTIAPRDTRYTDCEKASTHLQDKIARLRRQLVDPNSFATLGTGTLITDAEYRLRWIDCAPDGARFCLAPMQDKNGVPMGTAWSENLGPCKALRDARVAVGLHPLGAAAHYAWLAQSQGERLEVA